MKATSLARPQRGSNAADPWDERWAVELKWDGMRVQAHLTPQDTQLFSGSGKTITSSVPELAGLGPSIGARAVLDGEAIVFEAGRPSFAHLQHRIHLANPSPPILATYPIVYLIFDLLSLDGHDLTALPYRERRRLLEDLVEDDPSWKVPPYTIGEAVALLELAEQRELEGIVLKRLDSSYQPGRRSPDWVKVKVRKHQEFVVGGWTEGRNSLTGRIGSLLLGVQTDRGLTFAGAVGSGLTDAERARLAPLLTPGPNPFAGDGQTIVDAIAHRPIWVQPTLVVEAEYSLWPENGSIWHPVYLGQRVDRIAADVVRESS